MVTMAPACYSVAGIKLLTDCLAGFLEILTYPFPFLRPFFEIHKGNKSSWGLCKGIDMKCNHSSQTTYA